MSTEFSEARGWKQISLFASIQEGRRPVSLDEKHARPIPRQSTRTSLVEHEQRSAWEEITWSHPVLVPKNLIEDLEAFHETSALALTHIIERWGGTSE